MEFFRRTPNIHHRGAQSKRFFFSVLALIGIKKKIEVLNLITFTFLLRTKHFEK
jgi:hypothetical protein